MLRVLATPRWIGYTALAVLAIVLCMVAARWQYQRAQDELAVERAAAAALASYEQVVTADALSVDELGREVDVAGVGVANARSFIRTRANEAGVAGFLVVDGVKLPDGRVVPLLQGWVPDQESAPKPVSPGDPVQAIGRVQPDENFYRDAPITADKPLVTITAAGLTEQWGGNANLAPGYVTATSAATDFERSRPVFGSDPDVPFPLQNTLYSLQWLVFVALVIYVWVRGLRAAVARDAAKRESTLAPSGAGG
jgi:cytochrome oxidase assembly protein ShyY1